MSEWMRKEVKEGEMMPKGLPMTTDRQNRKVRGCVCMCVWMCVRVDPCSTQRRLAEQKS